jgi:sporulation protein YlmC with PRC-barrel domain
MCLILFNALICISKKDMGENEHGRLSNIILDTNSSKGTTLIVDDLHFTVTGTS